MSGQGPPSSSERVEYTIRSQKVLPSGRVQVNVTLHDGRRLGVLVDKGSTLPERLDPLVQAAIRSGRFDPLPPQPPVPEGS
jgi:hypothetical protein